MTWAGLLLATLGLLFTAQASAAAEKAAVAWHPSKPRVGDVAWILVQDVTDTPPANWDLMRRIDYLDWTEKVVAGCRGTNAPLEKLYDEVLKRGRAKFKS